MPIENENLPAVIQDVPLLEWNENNDVFLVDTLEKMFIKLKDQMECFLPETKSKDGKDIRGSLNIQMRSENTFVYLIAVHKETIKNELHKIPCGKGIPVGGYVYNHVDDTYTISCFNFISLGSVRASFKLGMVGVPDWSMWVPMPEIVLKRYLDYSQKEVYKQFIEKFNSPDLSVQTIQMVY